MTEITIDHLSKSFGAAVAVQDISCIVRPGRITGLVGPNGAGKSTLIRLVLDLEFGAGSALIGDARYRDLIDPIRIVGAVLDSQAEHPTRPVRQHLRMVAAGAGIGQARVNEVLAQVGMLHKASSRPRTLSLGEKQRMRLAQALLGRPDVLILDEPLNGLDPPTARSFTAFLRTFADGGGTVLLSSHLLADLETIADRVLVIDSGRLVADDTLTDFIDNTVTTVVLVRTSAPLELRFELQRAGGTVADDAAGGLQVTGLSQHQIGAVAERSGCPVYELFTKRGTLAESYLSLIGDSESFSATAPSAVARADVNRTLADAAVGVPSAPASEGWLL